MNKSLPGIDVSKENTSVVFDGLTQELPERGKQPRFVARGLSVQPMGRQLRPVLRPGWKLYRFSRYVIVRLFEICLSVLQSVPAYRRRVKRLCSDIVVKQADETERQQALDRLKPDVTFTDEANDIESTSFVAKKGDRTIGFVNLVRRPERYYPYDGYWLHGLKVESRYRGMGIGERLTIMVAGKSISERAKTLSLLVFENNRRSIALYRKLGFEVRTIPEMEEKLNEEQVAFKRRRVLMSVNLNGNIEI